MNQEVAKKDAEVDKAREELTKGTVESKADLKLAKEGLAKSIDELELARKQLSEMEAIQRQLDSSKKRIQMSDGAVRQVENLRALLDETQRQLTNRDMSLTDSQKTIEKLLKDKEKLTLDLTYEKQNSRNRNVAGH